uniref:Phlebovirus glycoprotein G2 fusion domain-containing protein n=1 Tax=Meloidogyne hapla TaxID=6305 RepID=A0A1I8BHS0_MELHA
MERKENKNNKGLLLTNPNIRRSEQKIKSENEIYLNLNNKPFALNELDIKSDGVLSKMMKRTTLTTREYPINKIILTTTQIPLINSLKPFNDLSQLPLLTFPGLPIPQQIIPSPNNQNNLQNQNIQSKQSEQFGQLGCGWDFLTQSCKDLFRVGWCQNCHDFGNQLMHDCRCIKVTNFYIQTTSFLGSSAASERANSANSAISSSFLSNKNIISTSPKTPAFGKFLKFLKNSKSL